MKRKLFIAGATFILAAAAVTAIAANQQTNEPTLLEANIEALGVGGGGEESGDGGIVTCCGDRKTCTREYCGTFYPSTGGVIQVYFK